MSRTDPHLISTPDALRELVGEVHPELGMKVLDRLDQFCLDFLSRSPFVVVATSDKNGHLDASPKGDSPGFTLVEDDQTLAIPDRPGNKLVFGHLNILDNPHVGLIFMVPGTPETLRIKGRAELTRDPELLDRLAARGRPAVLATRVRIDQCFFHCAKAFIRSNLWKPDHWGERHRVSFGEMFAAKVDADENAARAIDEAVELDYRTNL
jgi:PPOX class probable FMN-dependent enzyme